MNTNDTNPSYVNTHIASLGGDSIPCHAENFTEVCDLLVARHPGAGVPRVERMHAEPAPAPRALPHTTIALVALAAPVAPAPVAAPAVANTPAPVIGSGAVCVLGAARSQTDYDDAVAAGFAPKQPLFTRGTRVNSTGVDNARASRAEWSAMPPVGDVCAEIVRTVRAEERENTDPIRTSHMRFAKDGQLVTTNGRYLLTERGLQGIASRLDMVDLVKGTNLGSVGGAGYLARCKPELRAINLNHHARDLSTWEATQAAQQGFEPGTTVLRTRKNGEGREVFAAVSDLYAPFDVDKVALALGRAAPADAHATVAYDGHRAKFELVYHSDINASEYVAGEFFKAAVRVRTDDTGRGGLQVSAALFQNLCLNLIVIDQATMKFGSLRHIGNVAKLAEEFRRMFANAMRAVGPFIQKWGQAAREDIIARAITTEQLDGPIPIEEALPGFFNGIIERDLVPVPLHGQRRAEVVQQLSRMYDLDETRTGTLTRANVVNAVTRYAHEVESDPFAGALMEEAAGSLVASTKPLPYIALAS
jgi:hypothetical protein